MHIHNAKTAKTSARALEKFAARLNIDLKHGQALDAISAMMGFNNWAALSLQFSEQRINESLHENELSHIEDNAETRYGQECAVIAHNGFELRYDCDEELLTYVRICDPLGRELAYWTHGEWATDPQLVMGAILGALMRGQAAMVVQGKPSVIASPERAAPLVTDLPFENISNVLVNGDPYLVQVFEDQLRELRTPSGPELDEETALSLSYLKDGFVEEAEDVSYAQLRSMQWCFDKDCFVDHQGREWKFFVERPFSAADVMARQ